MEAAAGLEDRIDELLQDAKTGRPWNDGYVAIYFMLCAYAIENLLKARIVQKKRAELIVTLRSDPGLPKSLKGHDLYKLTREAGLKELAAEEEVLLHRLTGSAVWYGRYPVPIVAEHLSSFQRSEHKDFPILLTQYTTADRDDIKRFFREVG
jgi:hypothetical protein